MIFHTTIFIGYTVWIQCSIDYDIPLVIYYKYVCPNMFPWWLDGIKRCIRVNQTVCIGGWTIPSQSYQHLNSFFITCCTHYRTDSTDETPVHVVVLSPKYQALREIYIHVSEKVFVPVRVTRSTALVTVVLENMIVIILNPV